LRFHANEKALREEVGRRGQKWVELIGVHHMQYSGIAALRVMGKLMRHNVSVVSALPSLPLVLSLP
jgi:hypothetical protein